MTTIFRTTGPWGAGKGADLTPGEVDTNFYGLQNRIIGLEEGTTGGGAVGIDHITVSGNQMTIHMTDSSIQGPFTLPIGQLIPRGEWQASSLYHVNDTVTNNGNLYLVTTDHTSATDFDPGSPEYALLLSNTARTTVTVSTTTFVPNLEHAGTYIRFTSSTGCVITLPGPDDVAFPQNTEIYFHDAGGGGLVFQIATTGFINPVGGRQLATDTDHATVFVKLIDAETGEWDIAGLLALGT